MTDPILAVCCAPFAESTPCGCLIHKKSLRTVTVTGEKASLHALSLIWRQDSEEHFADEFLSSC